MKPLDLHTLLYVIGAISFLFALLMFLFYKRIPTVKGPMQWAYGSLSAVFGSLLFGLYPAVPGYIAFVVAGTFTILAIAYYLAGIRVYKGLQTNVYMLFGLVFLHFFFGKLVLHCSPNAQCAHGIFFCSVCNWVTFHHS